MRYGGGHVLKFGLQLRKDPLDQLPSLFPEIFKELVLQVVGVLGSRRVVDEGFDQRDGLLAKRFSQIVDYACNFAICDCLGEAPGVKLDFHEASFPAVLV
jgi:hypothetical protein